MRAPQPLASVSEEQKPCDSEGDNFAKCVGVHMCRNSSVYVWGPGIIFKCLPLLLSALFNETGFAAIPRVCCFVQGSPVCFFSPGITGACCHTLVEMSTGDLNMVFMLVL